MVTERQGDILNWIVKEYIDSARPISSQSLEKKARFGICPATIRIEMQKLADKGYLSQPHTSAGRVPTDKGYRFFVDDLLEKETDIREEIENWFEKEIKDEVRFIQVLTKSLAAYSQVLTFSYLEKEKLFWKEGWLEVLREPEFEEKKYLFSFTSFLEDFEKGIEGFKVNSEIKIYIGKEGPWKSAKDFSIISARCCLPEKKEGIISLLGPKRMDYDKNISLMKSLAEALAEAKEE